MLYYMYGGKMTIKTCTKCGEEKPATAGFFHRKGKSFRAACKVCRAERKKQYYQANREVIAERNKRYYQANREAIINQHKQSNQTNREAILEYYQANREAKAEYDKQYYQANREAKAEYYKQYQQAKIAEQPACVYQIVNNQNGRIYVGETFRGELRWKKHLTGLKGGYHPNTDLQKDFNKFGEEAFEWSIIKELPKDREILAKEEKLNIHKMIAEGKSLYNERLIT